MHYCGKYNRISKCQLDGSLVKRLRRRPLTAETGVRFPYELLNYKVKSRNISGENLDMVLELWVTQEEELVEQLSALPKVSSVSLMSHDGEVTF